MIVPNSSSVLLVGGPDSGKSNYLFRLWIAINSGKSFLVKNGLPEQLEYLRTGGAELLSGEFAQRTQFDVFSESVIPIKVGSDEEKSGTLVVPDCRGERWIAVYEKREWSTRWEQYFSGDTGILIFLRASSDQIISPFDWVQCEHQWGGPIGEGAAGAAPPPTQVVMTEWIQFIRKAYRDRKGGGIPLRVGIVVAAWDRVPNDQKENGPRAYLRQEFPLLSQFIETNEGLITFGVFGVTIAGGDFDDEPGFKERCLEQIDPLSLGYVVVETPTGPKSEMDMTLPIAWAMGFWPSRQA